MKALCDLFPEIGLERNMFGIVTSMRGAKGERSVEEWVEWLDKRVEESVGDCFIYFLFIIFHYFNFFFLLRSTLNFCRKFLGRFK